MDIQTPMSSDDDDWNLYQHCRDVAQERQRQWAETLVQFGSLEAWFDHCRKQRAEDSDLRLARVIRVLISHGAGRPQGTLRSTDRTRLLADKPLAAYWASVAAAGAIGFEEEKRRLGENFSHQSVEERARFGSFGTATIRRYLPYYRRWGQVLLDNEAVDLSAAFLLPGDTGL